jgi:hypothetical protein
MIRCRCGSGTLRIHSLEDIQAQVADEFWLVRDSRKHLVALPQTQRYGANPQHASRLGLM